MSGQQPGEGRMRLTVLGGYLGSGKTTWLRHQLHQGNFGTAHVIVNEAAETPVDDALLQQSAALSVLAGGCACCTGKNDLISLLRKICDARSAVTSTSHRLDRIVLETSGLADPAVIVETIRSDPVLVNHIVVGEVLVTVDALHGLAQLGSEVLGRRQAEVADCFIITKIDEANPEQVRTLLATVRSLNPGAALTGAVRGTASPLPEFAGTPPATLPPLQGAETSRPIFPARIHLDEGIDWAAFSVWLSALLHARGDDVVRVKGVVRTPAGRLLLQSVRRIVQSPEILPERSATIAGEDNTIVVIGRGYEPGDLTRSLQYFANAGNSKDKTA